MSSEVVPDSKLIEIKQSWIFNRLDYLHFKDLKEMTPDEQHEIASSCDVIRDHLRKVELLTVHSALVRRCKRAGLWSDFKHSSFNLVVALVERHSEIIGGNLMLSHLFVHKISSTSKKIRELMCQHRKCFRSEFDASNHFGCSDMSFMIHSMHMRQRLSYIVKFSLQFPEDVGVMALNNFGNHVLEIAADSEIEHLIVMFGHFTKKDRNAVTSFLRKDNRRCQIFNAFKNIKRLTLGEMEDEFLPVIFNAGITVPTTLDACTIESSEFLFRNPDLLDSVRYLGCYISNVLTGKTFSNIRELKVFRIYRGPAVTPMNLEEERVTFQAFLRAFPNVEKIEIDHTSILPSLSKWYLVGETYLYDEVLSCANLLCEWLQNNTKIESVDFSVLENKYDVNRFTKYFLHVMTTNLQRTRVTIL